MAKTTRFYHALLCLLCVLIIFAPSESQARGKHRAKAQTPRYASVIMDAQSGRILFQENANQSLPPASLTKMMTLFMTFEALQNGKLYMNKYLDISQNAINQKPSKLGLRLDSKITVKEAIYVLVTRSANDVAMALAETIGGSSANFCQLMTTRAHSLGMKQSYFYNPSGLPQPAQKSSAMDMAILARSLMQYFPQHYHFFNTIRYNYHGQTIETHNNLMRRFPGMDGLKTGYTYASGFNLVASAVRNNRRVIVSVFGGRTAAARDNHVADLMNQGLAQLERSKQTTQIAAAKPVQKTVTTTVTNTTVTAATPVTTPTVPPSVAAGKTPLTAQVTKTGTVTRTVAVTKPGTTLAAIAAKQAAPQKNWTPDGGQVRTLDLAGTPVARTVTQVMQQPVPVATAAGQPRNWGIQIGAYSDPSLGKQMLQSAQTRLRRVVPEVGQAIVVPIVTAQGTLYRARIIGLTPQSASRACQEITDCMAFAMR